MQHLGVWGRPAALTDPWCCVSLPERMQSRASWVVMRRASWKMTCTATSRRYSGMRIQSLGRSCSPPAAPHSYPCVPCTTLCDTEADLGWDFQMEQNPRKQAVCWERVNSASRGTVAKWQSLTMNGVSFWIQVAYTSKGKPQFDLWLDAALGWSIYT